MPAEGGEVRRGVEVEVPPPAARHEHGEGASGRADLALAVIHTGNLRPVGPVPDSGWERHEKESAAVQERAWSLGHSFLHAEHAVLVPRVVNSGWDRRTLQATVAVSREQEVELRCDVHRGS